MCTRIFNFASINYSDRRPPFSITRFFYFSTSILIILFCVVSFAWFFWYEGLFENFQPLCYSVSWYNTLQCNITLHILSLSVERTFEKSRGLPFVVTMVLLSRRHEFGTENIHKWPDTCKTLQNYNHLLR